MIKLYELRTERELSQRDLAKIMNVSQATYNNWENEKTQPSIEQLIALAEYFGVSVDFLIGKTSDEQLQPTQGNSLLNDFLSLSSEDKTLVQSWIERLKK